MQVMAIDQNDTMHRPRPRFRVHCDGELDPRWQELARLFDSAWDIKSPVKRKTSRKVVIRHEMDGCAFYVKIYSRRYADQIGHNLLRSSSLSLFPSKALKHLRRALMIEGLGIGIVRPLMVIERRYGLMRQESMLVTPECRLPTLARCFEDEERWERYLPALENMIRDISAMHDGGCVQWDPHFGNVLVDESLDVFWMDFGTIKLTRSDEKKTYRDLCKIRRKSIKVLEGRVDDPGAVATELLRRNYRDSRRLRAALESGPAGG